jgi:hypothetical protein
MTDPNHLDEAERGSRDCNGRFVPNDERPLDAIERHLGYAKESCAQIDRDSPVHRAIGHLLYALEAAGKAIRETAPDVKAEATTGGKWRCQTCKGAGLYQSQGRWMHCRDPLHNGPETVTPPTASDTKCEKCRGKGVVTCVMPIREETCPCCHGTGARPSPEKSEVEQVREYTAYDVRRVIPTESKPGETAGASLPPREGGGIHLAMLSDDDLEEALWLRARALELAVGLIGPPQQRILGLREALRELRPVLWTWEDRHTTRAEALAGALNAACERADKERDAERSRPTPQSPELSVEEWEALYVTVGAETNPVATMAQLALVKLEEGHRVPIAHSLSVPSPVEPAQEERGADEDGARRMFAHAIADMPAFARDLVGDWCLLLPADREALVRAYSFVRRECRRDLERENKEIREEMGEYWQALQELAATLPSTGGARLVDCARAAVQRIRELEQRAEVAESKFAEGESERSLTFRRWQDCYEDNQRLRERAREIEQERDALREALDEVARGDCEELKAVQAERDELRERHAKVRDEGLALYEALADLRSAKEAAEARNAAWSELVRIAILWRSSRPADPRDATGRLSRSLVEAVDAVPKELRTEGGKTV